MYTVQVLLQRVYSDAYNISPVASQCAQLSPNSLFAVYSYVLERCSGRVPLQRELTPLLKKESDPSFKKRPA